MKYKLSNENVVSNCDTAKCILNDALINHGVNNEIMRCGCTFKSCNLVSG